MVHVLVLLIVFSNGTFKKAEQLQPSVEVCMQKAGEFISQAPRDVENAMALSASCIVMDTTRPS